MVERVQEVATSLVRKYVPDHLATKKRGSMKSLHVKLNEALEKMTSKQRDKFYASRKNGSVVEVQLNCAEQILAGKVTESAPITKHNGLAHNHGELFTESDGGQQITEADRERAKSDKLMWDAMGISEADQRRLKNLPPVGVNLTPNQLREFRWLRQYRISESDAVRLSLKTT